MDTRRLYVSSKRRREVRNKKLVMSLVALIAIMFLSILVRSNLVVAHGNSKEDPVIHKYYKSIKIISGDTLWDIAETYKDGSHSSVNDYIEDIKKINGLHSDDIHESQYLTVAYYDTEFQSKIQ